MTSRGSAHMTHVWPIAPRRRRTAISGWCSTSTSGSGATWRTGCTTSFHSRWPRVLLGLDGLERRAPAAEAGRLAALREQLADALNLCTEVAVGLRAAVLDELGLAPALESLAERAGAHRVSVDPGLAATRLEPDLETDVYRTIEEVLAAMAVGCTLTVRLDAARHALVLSIHASDDTLDIDDLGRLEARMELIGRLSQRTRMRHDPDPDFRGQRGAASVFPQRRRVETPDGARLPLPLASRHDDFT
jgi:hypothetical protein